MTPPKALQSEENLRNYESKSVQILITLWKYTAMHKEMDLNALHT